MKLGPGWHRRLRSRSGGGDRRRRIRKQHRAAGLFTGGQRDSERAIELVTIKEGEGIVANTRFLKG
jgi:hypothetical protein